MFRLLAILLGLAPFLLFEAGLWLTGWRPTAPAGDPFVDFQTTRPLFVSTDDGRRMVTAADRLEYFRPESFAAAKPPGEFRIVCLGGSTVQGRPYQIETSFTTWLEISLRAADASRTWEVINCGGVSYASYRLLPILKEMLAYEPDLIIVYSGHNEFLEDRSYRAIKQTPQLLADAYGGLARLKSTRFLNQLFSHGRDISKPPNKDVLATEVDALLDYRGGLADYHRDPARRAATVKHYEFNLRRMASLARRAKVPLLLVDPPANLRDCPPFKSESTAGLTPAQRSAVDGLLAQARRSESVPAGKLAALEQAAAIDPHNASIHYRLGKWYDALGRLDEARASYQRANDEDVCPLRILQSMNEAVARAAHETETPLVEVRRLFQSRSEGGIPGDNLFVDHVHPTIDGHRLIAAEIMGGMVKLGIVNPRAGWEQRRDERYRQHWNSLDLVYFERGRQRLEGLRQWTQGRANKLRPGEENSAAGAIPLPAADDLVIRHWRRHADFEQPIAQFNTVFWDSRDSDALRTLIFGGISIREARPCWRMAVGRRSSSVQRLAADYGLQARLLDERDLSQLPPVFVPAAVIEVTPVD